MRFADERLIPLVDEGLGNSAYLLDLGDGRALAVDASRDLRALRAAADRRGLRVAYAADTHLHADFLSGAVQLGHDESATVLASAAGRRAFPHTALGDEDEVDLAGGMTAWREAGGPEAATAFTDAGHAPTGAYLDVRQASEFAGRPDDYAATHDLPLVTGP